MVTIVEMRRPVNREVVEMAESLLARAKSGAIVSLAYCANCPDGSVDSGHTATPDIMRLIAAIERLRHRTHIILDQNMRDVEKC